MYITILKGIMLSNNDSNILDPSKGIIGRRLKNSKMTKNYIPTVQEIIKYNYKFVVFIKYIQRYCIY